MGNGFIAFVVAAGASGFIHNKLMKSTGSNTKNSLVAASVSGILIFFILLAALAMIPAN